MKNLKAEGVADLSKILKTQLLQKKSIFSSKLKHEDMQQIIKKFQPLVWVVAIMLTVVFAYGCGGDTEKKDETKMEAAPTTTDTVMKSVTDSLPKVDSSASSRPEGIKTVTK